MGVIVLELISGLLDSKGPSFSQVAGVLQQRLQKDDSPPEHRQLASVLGKAVADRKEGRFATMREFREALLPALAKCPPILDGQPRGRAPRADMALPSETKTVETHPGDENSTVDLTAEDTKATGAGWE
jgi:hypothetical protein